METVTRRGIAVSDVRRTNEVNPRRARLVLGWVTVFGRVYDLVATSQLGQLGLIEYQLRLGVKAGMSPLLGGR